MTRSGGSFVVRRDSEREKCAIIQLKNPLVKPAVVCFDTAASLLPREAPSSPTRAALSGRAGALHIATTYK